MSGDELITIIIEDPHTKKVLSCRYNLLSVDFSYKGTKGKYHLMMLDNLVEQFNKRKNERD
jgi:hypothetical protein